MKKLTLAIGMSTITALSFAACASGTADDEISDGQFEAGQAASTTKSTDARLLNCHLEYQAFAPVFATAAAGQFETTFGKVENDGMFAADDRYGIHVSTNKQPPYNLSFTIQMFSLATNATISYIVLPRPHVGGQFLFELGSPIPPVEINGTSFDNMRAYCSIRNP